MDNAKGSYVVIFRAEPRSDIADDYLDTVRNLRNKALDEYGCTEFVYATTPEGHEVAISFWPDEDSIRAWKAELEHRDAQRRNARWYAAYRIQVGEIHRDYAHRND